jgi:hydroxymethylbilane synthase
VKPAPSRLRIGTRGSELALTQTRQVAELLQAALGEPVELVRVRTEGDRLRGSLAALGGAGLFVAALRDAVLDHRCDLAVHSLKDLPTGEAPGLVVAAIPGRADPRDALCARDGLTLAELPEGARVGTGSPRRAAQLLAIRPDLVIEDIRGNVGTRLGRVPGLADGPGDLDAVVLAAAGLSRIGRLGAATELLSPQVMSPAPGQGALAVECRSSLLGPDGDAELAAALAALDDDAARLAVTAERAMLAALEAGCAAPIGGLGRGAEEVLTLDAVVCRPDGTARLTASMSIDLAGRTPAERLSGARTLGADVAARLLADGAAELAPLGPGPEVDEP